MKAKISEIQKQLQLQKLDGWLLYVFRDTNPVAESMLDLGAEGVRSRRCFYWIPAQGSPISLMHRIEPKTLAHLEGRRQSYLSHQSLRQELAQMLKSASHIAMEYSPMAAIPTVSWVDGGTLELVRSLNVDVLSSAELIQYFEATLTQSQMDGHLRTATSLRDIATAAFAKVGTALKSREELSEYQVQQWIMNQFEKRGLHTDHPPIVGQNQHAGDPHYEPGADSSAVLRNNSVLLIDLWAKEKAPGSVFADETWMGWTGPDPVPAEVERLWCATRDAREAALELVKARFSANQRVEGWELDDAARQIIIRAGHGEDFIHRLGHSIHTVDHANGANLDNLETHETRPIIPATLFSIEPGIYLPTMGFRSEIDVLITAESKVVVAEGTRQHNLILCQN